MTGEERKPTATRVAGTKVTPVIDPKATYSAVSATFTVPKATPGANNPQERFQSSSVWVGIDGSTYDKAILQTGIYVELVNGTTRYTGWHEWLPSQAGDFSLAIRQGDILALRVRSHNSTSGWVEIENHTTGKAASKVMHAPNPTATLRGENAEWIVEDFTMKNVVPFVNFGQIDFWGAGADSAKEAQSNLHDTSTVDIRQAGKILTNTTILSNSHMKVVYAGANPPAAKPPAAKPPGGRKA